VDTTTRDVKLVASQAGGVGLVIHDGNLREVFTAKANKLHT